MKTNLSNKIEEVVVSSNSSKSVELSDKSVEEKKPIKKLKNKDETKVSTDLTILIEKLIETHIHINELHITHTNNIKKMFKLIQKEKSIYKIKNNKKNEKIKKKYNSNKNKTSLSDEEKKLTGLHIYFKIKPELAVFLKISNDSYASRTETFKIISKYIKKNKLNDLNNNMYFIPDEHLQTILSPLIEKDKDKEKGYSYFNIQRYIRHLFIY